MRKLTKHRLGGRPKNQKINGELKTRIVSALTKRGYKVKTVTLRPIGYRVIFTRGPYGLTSVYYSDSAIETLLNEAKK